MSMPIARPSAASSATRAPAHAAKPGAGALNSALEQFDLAADHFDLDSGPLGRVAESTSLRGLYP